MFIKSPSTDLIIILVIALLIFGPKRLPGLGKQLGQGMREFKDSITGNSKEDEDESPPELPSATASASATPSAPEASTTEREPVSQRPA